MTVSTSTFTTNTAGYEGGGLIAYGPYGSSASVSISGSTFSSNTAGQGGGGASFADFTTLTVSSSTFSKNTATFSPGGGLLISTYTSGTFSLTNNTIQGNIAQGPQSPGGGVCFEALSDAAETIRVALTISGNTVTGNSAGDGGGGLYVSADQYTALTATVSGNTISSNSISHQSGGGLYLSAASRTNSVSISQNTFSGNGGGYVGGGLWMAVAGTGQATLAGDTFASNTARDSGGGVFIASSGASANPVKLIDDTLSGNTAVYDGGGLYVDDLSTVKLVNVTIASNKAAVGGGVYDASGGAINLVNTLIATNTASSAAVGYDVYGAFTEIEAGFDLIGISDGSTGFTVGTLVGTFAKPLNPKLGALAANGGPTQTMALLAGSAALQAGTTSDSDVPTEDQRGTAWSDPSKPNIGAY